MAAPSSGDLGVVLAAMHAGDTDAKTRFLSLVYDDLRRMAANLLRRERAGHSWQRTDLTNEAVARLLGGQLPVANRAQFFSAAATTMQRLLVEHARLRKAQKRGPTWQRVALDDVADCCARQNMEVGALHDALERLARLNPRQSEIVAMRFIGGYTMTEIAQLLGVSKSKVEVDWRLARAWLSERLQGTPS